MNCLGAVVAGVVADDVDAGGVGVRQQQLIKQGNGGGGIDGALAFAPPIRVVDAFCGSGGLALGLMLTLHLF